MLLREIERQQLEIEARKLENKRQSAEIQRLKEENKQLRCQLAQASVNGLSGAGGIEPAVILSPTKSNFDSAAAAEIHTVLSDVQQLHKRVQDTLDSSIGR